jgi:hypothetical protein
LVLACAALPQLWGDTLWGGFIVIFVSAGQVFAIAIISTFMRICSKQVVASQFAIYMASSNLAFAGGALLLGAIGSIVSTTEILLGLALVFALVPFVFFAASKKTSGRPEQAVAA